MQAGALRFAIATDLGHATRELHAFLAGCDTVFLEANHCPGLLSIGPYPPRLKARVGGPLGHLTNEQTADVAAALDDTRVAHLVLVHLSRTNNTPERAQGVVASRVRRLRVETLPNGVPRRFDIRHAPGHAPPGHAPGQASSLAGAEQLFPLAAVHLGVSIRASSSLASERAIDYGQVCPSASCTADC